MRNKLGNGEDVKKATIMYTPADTNNFSRIKRDLFNQRVRDSITRAVMQAEERSKAGEHNYLGWFGLAGIVLAVACLAVVGV